MKRWIHLIVLLSAAAFLVGASAGGEDRGRNGPSKATDASELKEGDLQAGDPRATPRSAAGTEGAAPNFFMSSLSVNSGGDVDAASASFSSGLSVGQPAAGEMSSASYGIGLGFWYTTGGVCPVVLTGDVNLSSSLNASDIIYVVNFVFKSGPVPQPCQAAGDVDCSGAVSASDIIFMVNHVFKSQPAPCDVCTMIPGGWSCP